MSKNKNFAFFPWTLLRHSKKTLANAVLILLCKFTIVFLWNVKPV